MSPDEISSCNSNQAWQNTGSDFAAGIMRRLHGLLNRLLPLLSVISHLWTKPPTLQHLKVGSCVNHMDWSEGLISRLSPYYLSQNLLTKYEGITSVSPLSFIWIDPRWWLDQGIINPEQHTLDEAFPTYPSQILLDAITGRLVPVSSSHPGLFGKTYSGIPLKTVLLSGRKYAQRMPAYYQPLEEERYLKSDTEILCTATDSIAFMPSGLQEWYTQPELSSSKFTSATFNLESSIARRIEPFKRFLGADVQSKFILPIIPVVRTEKAYSESPLAQMESDLAVPAIWAETPDIVFPAVEHPPKMPLQASSRYKPQIGQGEESYLRETSPYDVGDQYETPIPFAHITAPIFSIKQMYGLVADKPGTETGATDYLIGSQAKPEITNYRDTAKGEVQLALAPIGRSLSTNNTTASSTVASNQATAPERSTGGAVSDSEALASEVYVILKRRLLVERERAQGII